MNRAITECCHLKKDHVNCCNPNISPTAQPYSAEALIKPAEKDLLERERSKDKVVIRGNSCEKRQQRCFNFDPLDRFQLLVIKCCYVRCRNVGLFVCFCAPSNYTLQTILST